MHQIQNETYNSIETALYFALKGEERLNLLLQEIWNPKTGSQTLEVEEVAEQWRLQKRICERLAKTLYHLNEGFTHEAFNPATLDGKGVCFLKTYDERKQDGSLIITVK